MPVTTKITDAIQRSPKGIKIGIDERKIRTSISFVQ